MAGTRSSARQAEKSQSSPPSATKNGTKRKADEQSSPAAKSKRGRPAKEQKTLEETINNNQEKDDGDEGRDEDMKDEQPEKQDDASAEVSETAENGAKNDGQPEKQEDTSGGASKTAENGAKEDDKTAENGAKEDDKTAENGAKEDDKTAESGAKEDDKTEANGTGDGDSKAELNGKKSALEKVKADENEEGKTSKKEEESLEETVKGEAVEEDEKREEAQPSNVLEKGVIYFFIRGRVGVDDPDSVQDLQRSFFVLRPLPPGGKLTDGAIQDVGNNRLIALPKKVFPKSGKDRFMAFTEKAQVNMDTLKEEFFQGSDYSTKTTGTRHTPEVTPVGEGVYAITSTGGGQGTTHLAYMLTIPSEIGEVQTDLGLAEKGSFALSLKNPESGAPVNALPNTAEFPKEIIDDFRGRGWMPAEPKHLDYVNSSFLMIGESDFENSSNLDPAPKDEKAGDKETPQEELEKLEDEDEHRVDNLKGDDTIFADLGISSKDYPKVLTTW